MRNKDTLIVGHGLAGAMLAQTFLKKGVSIEVRESDLPFHASKIAVGLVNPMIGPKFNPPHDIEECLLAINDFNQYFFKKLGSYFYDKLPLYRVFKNKNQMVLWSAKAKYIPHLTIEPQITNPKNALALGFHAPYGMGMTNCLRLRADEFLKHSKDALIDVGVWNDTMYSFDEDHYERIIFCEGFRIQQNPWFSYLPISPVRGEILQIDQPISSSASNGTWAVKSTVKTFFAGSTWDHKNLEVGPTEDGKKQILGNLNFMEVDEKKVSDQKSGVRTGTVDRNPIIGKHPRNNKIFVFNGFGSRGATTIPYYAEKLADYILETKPIPTNANLNRFKFK